MYSNNRTVVYSSRETAVMLGHSYVRRLRNDGFVESQLFLDYTRVIWKGHHGAKPINLIRDVVENFAQIRRDLGRVDVLFLFLGSNDLVTYENYGAVTVATWLFKLGLKFLESGVKRVALMECLPRFGEAGLCREGTTWCTVNPVGVDEVFFHERVKVFNDTLKVWVKTDSRLTYERLTGFRDEIQTMLFDGIHLDREGRDKLRRLLRRRVIWNCLKSVG